MVDQINGGINLTEVEQYNNTGVSNTPPAKRFFFDVFNFSQILSEVNNIHISFLPTDGTISIQIIEPTVSKVMHFGLMSYKDLENVVSQELDNLLYRVVQTPLTKDDIITLPIIITKDQLPLFKREPSALKEYFNAKYAIALSTLLDNKNKELIEARKEIPDLPVLNEIRCQRAKAIYTKGEYITEALPLNQVPFFFLEDASRITSLHHKTAKNFFFNKLKSFGTLSCVMPYSLYQTSVYNSLPGHIEDNVAVFPTKDELFRNSNKPISWVEGLIFKVMNIKRIDATHRFEVKLLSMINPMVLPEEIKIDKGTPLYLVDQSGDVLSCNMEGVTGSLNDIRPITTTETNGVKTKTNNAVNVDKNKQDIREKEFKFSLAESNLKKAQLEYDQYNISGSQLEKETKKAAEAAKKIKQSISAYENIKNDLEERVKNESGRRKVKTEKELDDTRTKINQFESSLEVYTAKYNILNQQSIATEENKNTLLQNVRTYEAEKLQLTIDLLKLRKELEEKQKGLIVTIEIHVPKLELYHDFDSFVMLCTPWTENGQFNFINGKSKELPVASNIIIENIFYYSQRACQGFFVGYEKDGDKKDRTEVNNDNFIKENKNNYLYYSFDVPDFFSSNKFTALLKNYSNNDNGNVPFGNSRDIARYYTMELWGRFILNLNEAFKINVVRYASPISAVEPTKVNPGDNVATDVTNDKDIKEIVDTNDKKVEVNSYTFESKGKGLATSVKTNKAVIDDFEKVIGEKLKPYNCNLNTTKDIIEAAIPILTLQKSQLLITSQEAKDQIGKLETYLSLFTAETFKDTTIVTYWSNSANLTPFYNTLIKTPMDAFERLKPIGAYGAQEEFYNKNIIAIHAKSAAIEIPKAADKSAKKTEYLKKNANLFIESLVMQRLSLAERQVHSTLKTVSSEKDTFFNKVFLYYSGNQFEKDFSIEKLMNKSTITDTDLQYVLEMEGGTALFQSSFKVLYDTIGKYIAYEEVLKNASGKYKDLDNTKKEEIVKFFVDLLKADTPRNTNIKNDYNNFLKSQSIKHDELLL